VRSETDGVPLRLVTFDPATDEKSTQ